MPEFKQKYYIVKESPIRIISKCKSHSKGTLRSFLIGMCMLYILMNWVPNALSIFFPTTNLDLLAASGSANMADLRGFPATPVVVVIYSLLFNGVFSLGQALYTLTYIRSRKVEYGALAEGLPLYFKALSVFVLQVMITAVWSMFFVIPGILAALNLSQAFYILADDPSKKATQVLAESRMMMYGNRMNYVRLLIAYIPYMLLAYIPTILISFAAAQVTITDNAYMIAAMIAEIPLFIVVGYMALGRCVFYELMLNKGFADFKYAGQDAFRELEDPSMINM